MKFNERLRRLRKLRDLSQKDLAKKLNVNQSTVAYYESGRNTPSYDVMKKIATVFGVTTDFLLGRPHKGDSILLNDDMYADGYTDESVLEELEERLIKLEDFELKEEKALEQKVLTLFNELSDDGKQVLLNVLEMLKKK